jgi:putative membrane protein
VLTVPSTFSESILSIQGDDPVQADISIRTDDAHSYLTGTVAQAVGQAMVGAFGNEITAQVITGLYSGFSEVGTSLETAADGASQLSGGVTELGAGLGELASGAASAQGGAEQLTTGLQRYTDGVSGLSGGLSQLNAGAGGLTQVSIGVTTYTQTIASLSGAIAAANAALQADPNDPAALNDLNTYSAGLAQAVAQSAALAPQTSGAISGIQGGIAQSAAGAARLAAGGPSLLSGARSLSTGLGGLTTGTSGAAAGAGELASGADELATGLSEGAEQVPAFDADQSAASAEVAADPVTLSVTTDNAVTDLGQGIATLLVPLGLWIGALAVFLVLRPVTRRALRSSADNGRLVFSALARAGVVTGAQAILLVALLHISLGVEWELLPASLGFALLLAAAFTAFHFVLTIGLGRAGLVVSLVLLAVQLTSTGGIYPIEVLATPFQAISPFLPLTSGVSGMQAIISGGNTGAAGLAVVVLLLVAVGSVLVAHVAIRRTRRAAALGLVPAAV